jgi:hypothetical protein
MKPIKITKENASKIDAEIDLIQEKAQVRLIYLSDVYQRIESIEKQLEKLLFKKDWNGLTFSVDENARKFPKSYFVTPVSTQYVLKREKSGWYFESISRKRCSEKMVITDLRPKANEMADYVSRFYL